MATAVNPWDNDSVVTPAPSAPAAPTAVAPTSTSSMPAAPTSAGSNPWDADTVVTPAPAPAPTYDAALFQQRVGRAPNPTELANFQATKGVGWAGDPGVITAPGESAINDAGTGFGMSIGNTMDGVHQIALHIGQHLGLVSPEDTAAFDAKVAQTRKDQAPTLATTAGMVGNIGGQGVQLALAPGGVIGTIAGSAALAGAQPTVGDESRTVNTLAGAAGGALGAGAGKILSYAAQPLRSVLSPEQQSAVDLLRSQNVPLDLAQQTGSRVAQSAKNIVADNPIVGSSTMPAKSQAGFNQAVLKVIGSDSNKADQATMGAAKDRIGAVMDDVASRNPVQFDNQLQSDLGAVQSSAGLELSDSQMAPINKQIDNILNKAAAGNGQIDGAAYQNIRSSLGRMTANQSDPATGHWAGQIQTAVDNAMQRSAAPEDLAHLVQARAQYRAMKQIQGAITDSDDVSPAALYNQIDTKGNAAQSVYGRGDQTLLNLAQSGKRILSDTKTPNSGSVSRLAGMAAAAGGADAIVEHKNLSPGRIAGAMAAGVALPMVLRAAVENPFFVNKIMGWNSSPTLAAIARGAGRGAQALGVQSGISVANSTSASP
jgi:hypothetical protein